MNYYPIPLDLKKIINGKKEDEEVDLVKSIHQNIRLILKSFTQSYRYDPNFGSILNKYHAATPPQNQSERVWRNGIREAIRQNLKAMLTQYEQRVKVKDVIIQLDGTAKQKQLDMLQVRVQVIGELTVGRKALFHYPDSEVAEEAQEVFPLLIPVGKK